MNKKLSRLLEPNLKLYFVCMVIFCLAAIPVKPLLAAAEACVTAALYYYFTNSSKKRRQGIIQYIDNLTGSVDSASKSTLINSPLPIMVFRPDTGEIIWSNENFLQLAGVREHLFEMKVEDAVPLFSELMKACADTQRSALLAQIDEKLNLWAEGCGLLLKTDRDHYLFLFEEQYYDHFVKDRFSILDSIRDIKAAESLHPTLSIGVGKDGEGLTELYKNANLSLEMALSRGGDQAVVRNRLDFEFYGGRAKTTEKRTKVKSRVMANALGELMEDADQIYIMGHSYADFDCLGAAAGLCCIARKRGKQAKIVLDLEHNAAGAVVEQLRRLPEYEHTFLSGNDAFLKVQPGALLIVADTNRPDMVESRQLLETCNRVAVIDHHRRAAEYIENAALNFHEPYASSAAELVTELLQYLVEPSDLLHAEAEALLAGIVLDTKHFSMRTGGRTFEAAAFLRRAGADTAEVQRLFQGNLGDMVTRYDIIRQARVVREGIALSVIGRDGIDRVAAAQAADELLTLKGIQASFVVYRTGRDVMMSARSLGDINVQVIVEALGGGGNSTTAGGRVEDADPADVGARLEAAIEDYCSQ